MNENASNDLMTLHVSPRNSLPHLTGIRAIAAYLVLFGHSIDTSFSYHGISFLHEYAAVFAYLGMSLFFVLSGFVITYSYYDSFIHKGWRTATRNFMLARFARLYPLYCVFLLLETYGLLLLWKKGTTAEQISYATLTQSWWNFQSLAVAPTWSISTEWFFYIAFAIMMACIVKWKKQINLRVIALISTIIFLLLLALTFIYREPITEWLSPLQHRNNKNMWEWLQYYSPYVRIGEFILGALAARLYMRESTLTKHSSQIICTMCLAAIFLVSLYNATHYGYDTFLFQLTTNFAYAPFIAYLLYACSLYPNTLTRLLSCRWLVAGGTISYSVYLMQFWVYQQLFPLLPSASWTEPSASEWFFLSMNVAILMLATTVIAFITWRFIEMPAQRLIRQI